MNSVYFLLGAGLLLAALAAVSIRYYLHGRRSAGATWEELLKRLNRVDRDKIATIALDAISETGEPRRGEDSLTLEPSEIWALLGGLEGLEALEQNCHVLVDMATYVQRWHPEALVVAEQLRLNAREIEWHVSRLKGAAETGNLQGSFAGYAQRAAATYYLMTRHVLELCEQAGFHGVAELRQAL